MSPMSMKERIFLYTRCQFQTIRSMLLNNSLKIKSPVLKCRPTPSLVVNTMSSQDIYTQQCPRRPPGVWKGEGRGYTRKLAGGAKVKCHGRRSDRRLGRYIINRERLET